MLNEKISRQILSYLNVQSMKIIINWRQIKKTQKYSKNNIKKINKE